MSRAQEPPASPWIDRFFETHFARHPVDATFVGLHEHDHRLPPLGQGEASATVDALRSVLEAPPSGMERVSGSDCGLGGRGSDGGGSDDGGFAALDDRLARGFLELRIWEYESGHVLSNPSAHVGDAVFGLMGPLLSAYAPLKTRLEAVEARMRALPAFLEDARGHVGTAPAAWARRAIRECRGGVRFLEAGLDRVEDPGAGAAMLGSASWTRARAGAVEAFRHFSDYLEREVLPRGREDVACGAAAFDGYLRHGHFLDRSADDIVAYARDEMLRTRSWLEAAALDFGGGAPEDIVARLSDRHPPPSAYRDRYTAVWREMKAVALERALLTWPDFPIEFVERPGWSRAAAPDLYFLFYRSPAAFGRPDVHRYMVAPLGPGLGPEETEAFLRANNDSVIKLNHVIHHGGVGHHVQNWHAFRSPSRVGRVAAIDCASRIAMFCGGTMAEGWACYATDLMAEAGALSELEQFAEHYGRVRMCARAIVDVELHHGRMSLTQAAAFYRDSAGMSPAAAEAESVKNSMFPGSALMYLVGTDMIHELRADLLGLLRDRFVLRDFHDAFLSYGSVPVKLVADELRRRARSGLPLGAHQDAQPADPHEPFE